LHQEELVSISEASHILGVSEAALRQWTDEGKIKAFITPGGHRRYARLELKKFITSPQKVLRIKDLVIELEDTIQLHREIDRAFLSSTLWYSKLSQDSQQALAHLGRRLLHLIIQYISEPSKREENLQLARDAGRSFGETLAKLGLPMTDAVEAFVLHHAPIMKVITRLATKPGALTGRVVDTIPLAARVMDETLVALVAAHQQYQDTHNQELKELTTE